MDRAKKLEKLQKDWYLPGRDLEMEALQFRTMALRFDEGESKSTDELQPQNATKEQTTGKTLIKRKIDDSPHEIPAKRQSLEVPMAIEGTSLKRTLKPMTEKGGKRLCKLSLSESTPSLPKEVIDSPKSISVAQRSSSVSHTSGKEEKLVEMESPKFIVLDNAIRTKYESAIEVLETFGKVVWQKTSDSATTHVVASKLRSTLALRGMLRGCWTLRSTWLDECLKRKRWITKNLHEFSLSHRSAAISNEANAQVKGDPAFSNNSSLFRDCSPIYIGKVEDIDKHIELGGGRTAFTKSRAKVIIGAGGLKKTWITDSIIAGKLLPQEDYKAK